MNKDKYNYYLKTADEWNRNIELSKKMLDDTIKKKDKLRCTNDMICGECSAFNPAANYDFYAIFPFKCRQ